MGCCACAAPRLLRRGFFTRVQSSCCPVAGGRGARGHSPGPCAARCDEVAPGSRPADPAVRGAEARGFFPVAPPPLHDHTSAISARGTLDRNRLVMIHQADLRPLRATSQDKADRPRAGDMREGAVPSSRWEPHPLRRRVRRSSRCRPAQRRPSFLLQAGHWPQPERAWSVWARIVCSSADACDGRPEPPMAFQVCAENWYRP